MKRTKKEFNEAVGVPEGIVDAGKRLYNDMKSQLKSMLNINQTEYDFDFKPTEPYKIGDMEIDDVNMKVTLHPIEGDDYGSSNMQVFKPQKLKDDGKNVVFMSVSPGGNIKLNIDKPVPEDWTVQGVIDSFEKDKVQGVSSFSHELKHEYDDFKKPVGSPSHVADYHAKVKFMGVPVKALQRLFYDLYYMDKVENLVRPTELYSKLKMKGVKKSGFLDYFKKEYSHILDAMKFNVDDLIKELYENMDEVENILYQIEDLDVDVDDMTDNEKVNELLRTAYISFSNTSGENLRNMLLTNPLEIIFGLSGNKEDYFQKHIRKNTKREDNPIEFYKDAEKYLKNTGRKVIKKMSKVYSLLPD
jgi:hypothetical protein